MIIRRAIKVFVPQSQGFIPILTIALSTDPDMPCMGTGGLIVPLLSPSWVHGLGIKFESLAILSSIKYKA